MQEGTNGTDALDQNANGVAVFCKLHKTPEVHKGPENEFEASSLKFCKILKGKGKGFDFNMNIECVTDSKKHEYL